MTTDELKTAARQISELMEKRSKDVKLSSYIGSLTLISEAMEDDSVDVPLEVLAELSPQCRKLALAGLLLLVQQVLVS